jgi:hypothetical protein
MSIFDNCDNKGIIITDDFLEREGWNPKVIVKSRGKCWVKTIEVLKRSPAKQHTYFASWDRFLFEPDRMRVTYLDLTDNDEWIQTQVDDYQDIRVFIGAVLSKLEHKRIYPTHNSLKK